MRSVKADCRSGQAPRCKKMHIEIISPARLPCPSARGQCPGDPMRDAQVTRRARRCPRRSRHRSSRCRRSSPRSRRSSPRSRCSVTAVLHGAAMTVRAVATFARSSRRFATKPLLSHGSSPRGRHDCPRSRRVRTEQPAVRHAVVAGPSSSRHGAAGSRYAVATVSHGTAANRPATVIPPWGRVE